MRILYAGHSLAEPLGGGELSARTLLNSLAEFSRVDVIGIGRQTCAYHLDKRLHCRDVEAASWTQALPYQLRAINAERKMGQAIGRQLRSSKPDLLILQQPGYVPIKELPYDLPVIVFIRSQICYGVWDPAPERWRRRLGTPLRVARYRKNRRLLDRADLIITNSKFMQSLVLEHTCLESHAVAPFITCRFSEHDRSGSGNRRLLFVGLDRWKGAELVLQLAEALPDRDFLILEGARVSTALRQKAANCPNVTCNPWTDDMGSVFDQAGIVLMPSMWEEPFGRVPVEAGARGIPTIAGTNGGLVESVGDGGILIEDFRNLSCWIQAIEGLDDRNQYDLLSMKAREHAKRFAFEVVFGRFSALVANKLSIHLTSGSEANAENLRQ